MVVTESKPVTITEGAIRQIRKLMEQEGFDATQKLKSRSKGWWLFRHVLYSGFDHQLKKTRHLKSKVSVVS